MEGPISPEEFRKLQIQVDILQRFLTKTFGSSFLEFCKDAQLSLRQTKLPPPLSNKGMGSSPVASNSTSTILTTIKSEVSNSRGATTNGGNKNEKAGSIKTTARRPPPPLLHRPTLTAMSKSADVAVLGNTEISRVVMNNAVKQDDFYDDDGNEEEEDVEILQPETVFSDEDTSPNSRKANDMQRGLTSRIRNSTGVKREHAVAFGYDETELEETNVNLPMGTDCVMIESEDEDITQPKYEYQEDDNDDVYADTNNDDELYSESYGYNEDIVQFQVEENYQTEEVQTDGNVTFGTLVTSPDTGIQYFQCAFCPSPKVFKHKQSLKEHYLLNHSPTPPAFQCQCGRRFLKLSQLKRHEVVHTAERPFVCPICHKDFTRKDNMTVHMVRNHAEKKHPCPYCPDKIYATPAEVNRHLRLYHSQWKQ